MPEPSVSMEMVQIRAWEAFDFVLVFLMWAIMMVGMMVPSAAPTMGAFRMGLHHGAFCVGCCWVLMGLLFVGGVMNLLWIAAIAIFIFAEKVMPTRHARAASRLTGAAMILVGMVLLVVWTAPTPGS